MPVSDAASASAALTTASAIAGMRKVMDVPRAIGSGEIAIRRLPVHAAAVMCALQP